jgi:hypothetical protein
MNEPRRWVEDPSTSAEVRRVLGAATAPPRLPASVHASVGEYAAKLAAQGVLAKVGGTSLLHSLLGAAGKALGVLSLVGAAGLGIHALQRAPSHSATGAPVRLSARRPIQPLTQVARPPAPAFERAQEPLPSHEAGQASSASRRASAEATSQRDPKSAEAPATASNVAESSLPAEAKLLQSARSFLDDSPALALELTERHQRSYPNGQLGAEREFIAIAALLGLGRRQEAEHRAAPALARAPDSLYARRLRGLLDGKRGSEANREIP